MTSFAGAEQSPTTSAATTGTTIVAVTFEDGVVIGADSRVSVGGYVHNRASRKVACIHDRIYAARAGSAADTEVVAKMVRWFLSQHVLELGESPRVSSAASLFRLVCYNNKEYLKASIIVGGWDKENGPQVFGIPQGGGLFPAPYAISGSGASYIYGYVDAQWKPNMSKGEAEKFVASTIAHAMARDGSSGGMIRLTTIMEKGVCEIDIPGSAIPFGL